MQARRIAEQPSPARPIRVLCLTQYDESIASSRVRVYQFVPYLEEAGFQVDVRPLLHRQGYGLLRALAEKESTIGLLGSLASTAVCYLARVGHVLAAASYDVVLVQKDVLPFGLRALLKLRNTKLIFDFDDPIWMSHPASGQKTGIGGLIRWYRERLLLAMLRQARAVVTDNELIKQYALPFQPNIKVICSPIDTRFYPHRLPPERVEGEAIFGWIGSPGTTYLLKDLLPRLEALARFRPVRLVNVGGIPLTSQVIPIENLDWSLDEEKRTMHRAHVGLVPTDDKPFNRYRFVYKAVIYFCAGVPCLAADVGLNRDMIENGVTGIRYGEGDGFVTEAKRLLDSPELRRSISRNARQMAECVYDVRVLARPLIELIAQVANEETNRV